MKLASMADGSRDGRLIVVSRDLKQAVDVSSIATNLQEALERWTEVEPQLQAVFARLQQETAAEAFPIALQALLAPLPRAWQWLDGSAFESHGELMQKVFNLPLVETDYPLMYQGMSDCFYSAYEDVPFPTTADGIDFEGEFGVLVDSTPMGVTPAEAATHIRLLVQINDWSLRVLAPREMKTGFGWVQAKPPCSMAPVAITTDELGAAWKDYRVHLPLLVDWNGKRFGAAHGGAMGFGFHELVAHAARTRKLVAGTVIGSGTVSNADFRDVGSSCIAERRGIELLDEGKSTTPFMQFGEVVRMDAHAPDGSSLFGPIEQRVVSASF